MTEPRGPGQTIRELEAIIDSSFDGFYVTDNEGVCLRINQAYERLSGYPADVFVGRRVEELISEGYIGRSVVPDVLRTGKQQTIVNHTRSGKRLLSTGTPILDERRRLWRVVCNVRDITELAELQRALDDTQQLAEYYRDSLDRLHGTTGRGTNTLVSRSPAMERVIQSCLRVARVESPVLLSGESGVGKEMLADFIHSHSPRRDQPLIKVNCSAIPEALMESEFFGYEAGAFTGAQQKGKPGFFELANRGILFLDEVGELPLSMQPKLLRVLQDFEVLRLGGTHLHRVDVRIIAASNRDLEELARQGHFRWDLYYRLNVIPVTVPSLRDRREDIPMLVSQFLSRFGASGRHGGAGAKSISVEAMDALVSYPWPGNVRELRNAIERLVVLTDAERIEVSDLPASLPPGAAALPRQPADPPASLPPRLAATWAESRREHEGELLEQAIREYGSLRRAAKALGVSHSTLSRKARQLKDPAAHPSSWARKETNHGL